MGYTFYNWKGTPYNVPTLSDLSQSGLIKSICHQGYKKDGAVQNTIPAFEQAKQKGFKYIECDIRSTADGVQVLFHDDDIAKHITSHTLDSLLVSASTYSTLQQYTLGSGNNAAKLSSFDEFVYWCKINGMHPYLDFKSGANVNKVIDIIKKHNMDDNVTFINTNDALLSAFPRGSFCGLGLSLERCLAIKTEHNHVFTDLNGFYITEEDVRSYTSQGVPVEAYTINDKLLIRQLISWGVRGVTTDEFDAQAVVLENQEEVVGVSLNTFTENISVGETLTLIPTLLPYTTTNTSGVVWESSDTSIAVVENGVVTGISAGTATITATPNANTTNKRAKAICTVTVN